MRSNSGVVLTYELDKQGKIARDVAFFLFLNPHVFNPISCYKSFVISLFLFTDIDNGVGVVKILLNPCKLNNDIAHS